MSISVGIRQALGLFLTPLTSDLNVGREMFALSMGMMNLLWGAGAPLAGAVADKYGARTVALLGGAFYAAGLVVMALSGSGDGLLLGGTLLGLGLSGSGFTVVLGTVGRLVPEARRSQALGIASVGGSIGQFLALPYTHGLIGAFGWSVALIILAATALLIVPLSVGLKGRNSEAPTAGATNLSLALQ
ncbi:MFS transporter [Rhodovibrionaceae bacterium A322]